MWTEKYAPVQEADLAWSHQKLKELRGIVAGAQGEAEAKRRLCRTAPHGAVVLMHGPSGCGKLSALRALFDNPENVRFDIFYGNEASADELRSFLGDAIITLTAGGHRTFEGDNNSCHSNEPFPSHPSALHKSAGSTTKLRQTESSTEFVDVDDEDDDDFLKPDSRRPRFAAGTRASAAPASQVSMTPPRTTSSLLTPVRPALALGSAPGIVFKVVKGLPQTLFGDRRQLDAVISNFVGRFMERCSRSAMNQVAGPTPAVPPPVVLVFFLHTVHDTHSEKVDLSSVFPPDVVRRVSERSQQRAATCVVQQFRCTPITTNALARRLTAICQAERMCFSAAMKEMVAVVAAQSSGDMRQAVLQLQWSCLTPPTASASPNQSPAQVAGKKRPRSAAKPTTMIDLCDGLRVIDADRSAGDDGDQTAQLPSKSSRTPFRDEYIDIGHAAARILTQKYDAAEVLRVTPAPPWKLQGFVTHNMHNYFNANQISELADCTCMASFLERCVPFAEGAVSAASEHKLGEVALIIFSRFYHVNHKHVQVPRTLLAIRAPHYQSAFFPVVFQHHGQGRNWPWGESMAAESIAILDPNDDSLEPQFQRCAETIRERHELTRFVHQLEASAANGTPLNPAVCIGHVRELLGSPADMLWSAADVIMDLVPLASRIILDVGYTTPQPLERHHASVPTAPAEASAPRRTLFQSNLPPKRTLFQPSGAAGPRSSAFLAVRSETLALLSSYMHLQRVVRGGVFRRSGISSAFMHPLPLTMKPRATVQVLTANSKTEGAAADSFDPIEDSD